MSERNVKLFYNEMCKNEKLQNEIKGVLGGANTESDKQALLNDIAKKYHFDFTPEEAKKFAENLSKNELSLDDISEVSGGIGRRTAAIAFTALTALGSLGSAGAIISHAEGPGDEQTSNSNENITNKDAEGEAGEIVEEGKEEEEGEGEIVEEGKEEEGREGEIVNGQNQEEEAKRIIEKQKDIKLEEIKETIKHLYNNANDDTASETTEGSQCKKLASEIKNLFNSSTKKSEAANFISNLFSNSEYYFFYKKGGEGGLKELGGLLKYSYYLLQHKDNPKDRYCLAMSKMASTYKGLFGRTLVYYDQNGNYKPLAPKIIDNIEIMPHRQLLQGVVYGLGRLFKSEDTRQADALEKELHQRRLFRNALEILQKDNELKPFATDLIAKIMPDGSSLTLSNFYRAQ